MATCSGSRTSNASEVRNALQSASLRFLAALQFLTRLPMPGWVGHSPEALAGASAFLPLVGLLVGAIGAAAFSLARWWWPTAVALLLSMAATILVTGALHEDGLADAADAFGGGFDREQTLTIMKDPRIGVFGAIALILALLLKFETLAALPAGRVASALVAGHAISRLAALGLLASLPYVGEGATSRVGPLADRVRAPALVLGSLLGIGPLFFLGRSGAVGLAGVIVIALAWRWYILRRIAGYTGDCLGAGQQLTELAFYLGLAVGPQ